MENQHSFIPHGSMTIWGETDRTAPFFGRERELATLRRWISVDSCQLIAILGMGGMGKTALAIQLGHALHHDYASVIWHSLRNAPPLEESLTACITMLAADQTHVPVGLEPKLTLVLEYLQATPCLLIFDNFEALLQRGRTGKVGHFLQEYEEYGHFLHQVSELPHQSCLVLTSREKPIMLSRIAGQHAPVRSLHLRGLAKEEGSQVLANRQIRGSVQDIAHLSHHFAGNPLALQLVAGAIDDLFVGDLAAFLKTGEHIFSDIRDLLDEQFERLSTEERDLLFWLAIERQDLSLQELINDLAVNTTRNRVVELLDFLMRRRSWVEHGALEGSYTLQPVIMEYITACLVEQIYDELCAGQYKVINSHALMQAQMHEYIRRIQERLLLKPILEKLFQGRSQQQGEALLFQALASLQRRQPMRGYAAGNVLNLLILLHADLRGRDFNHLTIWQTDFQNVALQDTAFTHADFTSSAFTGAFALISALAFSSDGSMLAAGTIKGEVQVWHLPDGNLIFSAMGHHAWVMTLAFNQQGSLLASGGGDHMLCLWDLPGGQRARAWQGHRREVSVVAFNPIGSLLASGSFDQEIKLWDVPSGQIKHTFADCTDTVTALTFNAAGTLLAGGCEDRNVRVWDVATQCCVQNLQGHVHPVKAVAFSALDSRVISADLHEVRIWNDTNSSCAVRTIPAIDGLYVTMLVTTTGAILLAVKERQRVQVYDLEKQTYLSTMEDQSNPFGILTFSPDGNLLAGTGQEWRLKVWMVAGGQCLKTFYGYSNTLGSLAFSPTGGLVAGGGADQHVRLWDDANGRCLKSLQGHSSTIGIVAFSSDGTLLASGSSDQSVRLWEAASGHCLATWKHESTVWAAAFSADGKRLAGGCHDGSVSIWEVASGNCLTALPGQLQPVDAVAVAFAGQRVLLAIGDRSHSIQVWEVGHAKHLHTLIGHHLPIWSLAFSSDGTLLASGSGDHEIRVWDVESGACLQQITGHQGWISALAFNRDGNCLASGGSDCRVNVWDVASGACIASHQEHQHRVAAVALSPDGNRLISSDYGEKILQWDVQTAVFIRELDYDRLYERMDITGVMGISDAQKQSLRSLGAIETGQSGIHHPQARSTSIRLTRREREILLLMTAGKSNEEIIEHLVISKATVKTHINHLFAKLQVHDRAHAVRRGQQLHLLFAEANVAQVLVATDNPSDR